MQYFLTPTASAAHDRLAETIVVLNLPRITPDSETHTRQLSPVP